ncbi:MAG: tetratricopeptide repeat protein [Deltaproteobacteria bacterium]|nr:tetratricopeptide repeat protein [Deltaproteobacteria bacterium]
MRSLVVVVVVAFAAPAVAQPADTSRARSLYVEGDTHFRLAEYDQAIVLFKEAYRLDPAPGLLFNLAQAYRLKGDCRQALWFYEKFAHSEADPAAVANADVHLASVRACVAKLDAAGSPAGRRTWKSWVGIGVGVAGAAGAIGGGLFARDAADQAHQRELACNDVDGCTAAQARAFDDAGHAARGRAIGLFAVGGLALAGGVTLYLLDRPGARVTIAPVEHGATVAFAVGL